MPNKGSLSVTTLSSTTLLQAEMFECSTAIHFLSRLWMLLWGHIPCWTRQSSGQNFLSFMRIQSSRAAVVHWHCTRFCRDTTSRRHFLRLWFCWTSSITTPMTTAEAERCFSTLKRIKDVPVQCNGARNALVALAMLSMERELVRNMPDFNERVIDHFCCFERETSKI